ncbi:hypothetical protein K2173_012906 (mitochondrion) [Erythroxylum novogranatense]|uniref:Uncharacterized protein n=1 Tax=Erythroxylum novogranatense TaxID=1862640 RepID=A0AAV8S442_9ROSI|nr:hypothetical protein K2173_012906 [Erythroxylum novogranatense]
MRLALSSFLFIYLAFYLPLPEVLPSIPSPQRTEAPNRQSQSELSGAVLFGETREKAIRVGFYRLGRLFLGLFSYLPLPELLPRLKLAYTRHGEEAICCRGVSRPATQRLTGKKEGQVHLDSYNGQGDVGRRPLIDLLELPSLPFDSGFSKENPKAFVKSVGDANEALTLAALGG